MEAEKWTQRTSVKASGMEGGVREFRIAFRHFVAIDTCSTEGFLSRSLSTVRTEGASRKL